MCKTFGEECRYLHILASRRGSFRMGIWISLFLLEYLKLVYHFFLSFFLKFIYLFLEIPTTFQISCIICVSEIITEGEPIDRFKPSRAWSPVKATPVQVNDIFYLSLDGVHKMINYAVLTWNPRIPHAGDLNGVSRFFAFPAKKVTAGCRELQSHILASI